MTGIRSHLLMAAAILICDQMRQRRKLALIQICRRFLCGSTGPVEARRGHSLPLWVRATWIPLAGSCPGCNSSQLGGSPLGVPGTPLQDRSCQRR